MPTTMVWDLAGLAAGARAPPRFTVTAASTEAAGDSCLRSACGSPATAGTGAGTGVARAPGVALHGTRKETQQQRTE